MTHTPHQQKSSRHAISGRQATNNSLSEVKPTAEDIMKGHPDLLERFISFLPKEVRTVYVQPIVDNANAQGGF